jgi:uncharacterized protein (TIGR02594 family)
MPDIDFSVHPWMDIAARELGEREIAGTKSNKRILEYWKGVGTMDQDETPWCSAFVNFVLRSAGYAITGRANARSWLDYGVPLDQPQYGAITVFWRDSIQGPFGHVAFYLADRGVDVRVLGGNQQNAVAGGLYARVRLLGYRWPMLARG